MAAHDGLDIAAVLVFHLITDTHAAVIRRDDNDNDSTDTDDATIVTVTTTALATPSGSLATASATAGNLTSSTQASDSGGSQLDRGAQAGIAIGAIVGGFFIAGAVFMITRRWLRNRRAKRLGPNNPHIVVTKDIRPSNDGGAGGASSAEEKAAHLSSITTSSGGDRPGARPWFDTGTGSTELDANTGAERGRPHGVSSWILEKAELPTPQPEHHVADGFQHGDVRAELPDAKGTPLDPVELPACLPRQSEREHEVDSVGMVDARRNYSQRTWTTNTTSSYNASTLVSSPTGTTVTEEGDPSMVSPCSTGSAGNPAGNIAM